MYGPYERPGRARPWQVVILTPAGERADRWFETEGEAKAALADIREEFALAAVTVDQAIDLYGDHQRQKGNAPRSMDTTRHRLRLLLDDVLEYCVIDITPRRASRLYDALVDGVSVDTHRNALNEAKSWARWLVKKGYISGNPWEAVDGVGKRKRGKEQLTHDEATKLADHCLSAIREDRADDGVYGVSLALFAGLRASEICGLRCRDLDGHGRLIVVRKAKSDAGVRSIVVPDVLREHLVRHADRKGGGISPLVALSRYRLRDGCLRLCEEAGVTPVGPHGLRGTHASLAMASGLASEAVAASLGHASPVVTERHYATAESVSAGRQDRALKVLTGGRRG